MDQMNTEGVHPLVCMDGWIACLHWVIYTFSIHLIDSYKCNLTLSVSDTTGTEVYKAFLKKITFISFPYTTIPTHNGRLALANPSSIYLQKLAFSLPYFTIGTISISSLSCLHQQIFFNQARTSYFLLEDKEESCLFSFSPNF